MVMPSSSTGFLFPPLSLCFPVRHLFWVFFLSFSSTSVYFCSSLCIALYHALFVFFFSTSVPLFPVFFPLLYFPSCCLRFPPFLLLLDLPLCFFFLLPCSLVHLEAKLLLGDEDDGEADRSKLLSSSALPLFFLLSVFFFLCIFKSFFLPLFSLSPLSLLSGSPFYSQNCMRFLIMKTVRTIIAVVTVEK